MRSSLSVSVLAFVASLSGSSGADPSVVVALSCEPKSAPGRVLCEAEVEASTGRLAWADLVVLASPDFAPPLKSRVSPREAKALGGRRMRLPIAFLAKTDGKGTVTVQVRAVVCGEPHSEACATAVRSQSAELSVGPLGP